MKSMAHSEYKSEEIIWATQMLEMESYPAYGDRALVAPCAARRHFETTADPPANQFRGKKLLIEMAWRLRSHPSSQGLRHRSANVIFFKISTPLALVDEILSKFPHNMNIWNFEVQGINFGAYMVASHAIGQGTSDSLGWCASRSVPSSWKHAVVCLDSYQSSLTSS